MVRPKKPRLIGGVVLADNLYKTKRDNYFRYLRPDGTWKYFTCASPSSANKIAEDANKLRDQIPTKKKGRVGRDHLSFYIPLFIAHRESFDPKLKDKASWKNRRYTLTGFGKQFDSTPVGRIDRELISNWWLTLTCHQQKQRHAELRRLFNWLMGQGLCPRLDYNPFTTADDKPRLYESGNKGKARMRLSRDEFWKVYRQAGLLGYEGLQIAMGVSMLTFMREGDICALTISEHLQDNLLKKVIGKSFAQKGAANASRLSWSENNYQLLRQLIKRGRELSMKNIRCPNLISHMPKQRRKGKTKGHVCQITPRRLGDMFKEARIAAKVQISLPSGRTPATFHEVRSLASKLALDAGHEVKDIQVAMAHGDESTTRSYQAEHDLPFKPVEIVFTKEIIGGDFR